MALTKSKEVHVLIYKRIYQPGILILNDYVTHTNIIVKGYEKEISIAGLQT